MLVWLLCMCVVRVRCWLNVIFIWLLFIGNCVVIEVVSGMLAGLFSGVGSFRCVLIRFECR